MTLFYLNFFTSTATISGDNPIGQRKRSTKPYRDENCSRKPKQILSLFPSSLKQANNL